MTTIPAKRVLQQKVSTLGSLHAAIVGLQPGTTLTEVFQFLIWNDAGRWAMWPLAGVSDNVTEACCALVPTVPGGIVPGRLVVSTRNANQQTVISEFLLPPDLFSGAPTVAQQQFPYGDGDSRGAELAVLPSGQVVSMTYQHSSVSLHAALRSPGGTWAYQGLFAVTPSTMHSHQFSMARAPWDNSILAFIASDGGYGIDLGVFQVVSSRLQMVRSVPAWVNRQNVNGAFTMGLKTPDGEIPAIVAVTDQARGQVLTSYTNDDGASYPMINGRNQSHPVLVAVKSDLSSTLLSVGADLIQAVLNPSPAFTLPSSPAMAWLLGIPQVSIAPSGGVPVPVAAPGVAYAPENGDLVYLAPSGQVTLLQAFQGAPVPVPVPPVEPVLLCTPLVSFSWSLSDPTGSNGAIPGKFMLQQGASATGPWTDIIDHWQMSKPMHEFPLRLSGNLWSVDGAFYRLRPV